MLITLQLNIARNNTRFGSVSAFDKITIKQNRDVICKNTNAIQIVLREFITKTKEGIK